MIRLLKNTLLVLLGVFLLSGLGSFAALAVDNNESGNDLNQASLLGSFMRDTYFPATAMPTGLLGVFSPTRDCQGTIEYCLDAPQKIALCVYDQQGLEVVELLDQTKVSGSHHANWDGCSKDGQAAPDGTYFLMMKTEESVFLRRMVLDR